MAPRKRNPVRPAALVLTGRRKRAMVQPRPAKRGLMPDADNDARIVKSADAARAGVTGQHVRNVLVTSLIAAILLLIVIAAISFS